MIIKTTDEYWECGCDARHGYIHHVSEVTCDRCKALQEDSPSARVSEVEELGLVIKNHPPA